MIANTYRYMRMRPIERHSGKIVIRSPKPRWWRGPARKYGLLLIQFIAMVARTSMLLAALTFFVLWMTDTGYWLWIALTAVSVFSLVVTSKIVLYIKKHRGVI